MWNMKIALWNSIKIKIFFFVLWEKEDMHCIKISNTISNALKLMNHKEQV